MNTPRVESPPMLVEILLIGNLREASEFALPMMLPETRLVQAGDVAAAIELLAGSSPGPALIVVAQNRPGEITAAEIAQLRAAAPLAPICGLLGSLCEGETRSGKPWPGVPRCYWHQWPARFAREVTALAAGRAAVWTLPATASSDEQLLTAVEQSSCQGEQRGLLAIIAENAAAADALSDSAQARGYTTAVLRSSRAAKISGARAAIWDTRPEKAVDRQWVAEISAAVGDTPLVALVNFPRADFVNNARTAGVAAIVSKPMLLNDLFWQVEQVARPPAPIS